MGTPESSASTSRPATGKRGIALFLVALLVAIGTLVAWPGRTPGPEPTPEIRMPIANPVLEPDRPDLIGEPPVPASPE